MHRLRSTIQQELHTAQAPGNTPPRDLGEPQGEPCNSGGNERYDQDAVVPVEGEMVLAAVNEDRTKWMIGQVIAPTENAASYRAHRYGPLISGPVPAKWPTECSKMGFHASKTTFWTRRDEEVVYDVQPKDVIYVFRELEAAETIPAQAFQALEAALPRGVSTLEALDWTSRAK